MTEKKSAYEKLFGGDTKPEAYSEEVGGSFQCQICDLFVYSARHYPTESLLVWECSDGHRSYIEEFV